MRTAAALRERFAVWALRTRPPEPSPVVLGQRRVYVLPTRAGLAFGASLPVLLLGAINYNLSLGYALTFLLAGLGVAAILNAFRNLVGLVVEPGRAEPVFAGERARFRLILRNRRGQERPTLGVRTPGGEIQAIDLPAADSAEVVLDLPAERRGWLPLPRVTIDTTYPLGIIRAWSYCAPDFRCLVYPKPAVTAPPLPFAAGDDSGLVAGSQGNDDFVGLRSHQQTDSPRHVAWKIAARREAEAPLLTKEFAGTAAAALWLDWDAVPAALDDERRLAILARWVLDARAAGYAWGL
ncbi:MAG TPA: DUF58 domain-containing protein, partial [Rhodocyclaceae bacterium]|nr:DUF58 domain-containing protein [Rhodocyclaceae bacterium]